MLHGFFSSTAKHQDNYFLYKIMGIFFFVLPLFVWILYIRVYDCFSVWSQNLKYESEEN